MMDEDSTTQTRWRRSLGVLRAFAPGALAGLVTIQAERTFLGFPSGVAGAAAYCLVGGSVAAFGWLAGSLAGVPSLARVLSAICAGALPTAFLVYVVNVRLFPGEPFTSAKSLAADILAISIVGIVALAVARAVKRFSEGRIVAFASSLAGTVLLVGSAATIIMLAAADLSPLGRRLPDSSLPNLLVILQDSARPDHLSLHGYSRATSPTLNELSREARVFERAYAASSWTAPSVDWILSVRGHSQTRLPQRLTARGYRTACFTDNPHLTRSSEILRGFEVVRRSVGTWRLLVHSTVVGEVLERLAPGSDRMLVDGALAWAGTEGGPLFLYVHLMDSHAPYDAPPIDGVLREGRRIEFPMAGMELSDSERDDIVARYDGGILSTDVQVRRLFEAMERRTRPFLAIIASDHGESLGEQGRWYHGGSLAPELLAVHLVVTGPDVVAGRILGPVGFSSITKTLLLAAGDSCDGCPGVDLRRGTEEPFVEGALPPRLVYRIEDGFKLIWDHSKKDAQLFDLENDPHELVDIASDHPDLVAALRRKVSAPRELPESDPAAVERLRALGYVE